MGISNSKKSDNFFLPYSGKHLLEDSISSYLANNYSNYEVAVMDNGSKDGTEDWVKMNYPGVFVSRTEKKLGYYEDELKLIVGHIGNHYCPTNIK